MEFGTLIRSSVGAGTTRLAAPERDAYTPKNSPASTEHGAARPTRARNAFGQPGQRQSQTERKFERDILCPSKLLSRSTVRSLFLNLRAKLPSSARLPRRKPSRRAIPLPS